MSPEQAAALKQRQDILNAALRGLGGMWAQRAGVPMSALMAPGPGGLPAMPAPAGPATPAPMPPPYIPPPPDGGGSL